jgi:peroxisomal membrane protein 4
MPTGSPVSLTFDKNALLSIVRGMRNGFVYGFKIRLPHAFVMTMLFRDGPLYDKIEAILRATWQHSRNLGCYVAVFKLVRALLRHFRGTEDHWNTTLAGAVGGAVLFGSNDPVSSQINMYVMSRVIFGLGRTANNKGFPYHPRYHTVFGSACWALVMYLFFHQPGTLQSSLAASMQYLYKDSDYFPAAKNLWTWLTTSAYAPKA